MNQEIYVQMLELKVKYLTARIQSTDKAECEWLDELLNTIDAQFNGFANFTTISVAEKINLTFTKFESQVISEFLQACDAVCSQLEMYENEDSDVVVEITRYKTLQRLLPVSIKTEFSIKS